MITRTAKRKARLSITLDPELKAVAEKIAKEDNTTPSGVISRCLARLAADRKEKMMVEYYQSMSKEHDDYAKKSAKVIQKIASNWKD